MRQRRWIILGVLFAARAATGFQFQSIGSATNLLMTDLAIGYSQIGMLLGAYLLPGVIVAFPAGLLGQRISEKTLGLTGLALMAVSGLVLSYSGDFALALAARLIGGVGATIVILVATKMVADWFDAREMVLAMSLLQMSWPFGFMIALPIQAWIGQSFGAPAVMASGGIAAAAVFCAFALLPRSSQPIAASAGRGKLPGAVLAPVIVAGVIWGAMNLACVLFFTYAPLLMKARGSSAMVSTSFTSLAISFTIIAIPAGGYLVHRSGRPIVAIVICGIFAAAALALFVADFHPTISCLIFGVAIGPLSGAILSLPAKVLAPAERSVGFGLFFTCFYVLMAVGPIAAGHLQDAWGSPSAALVASAALLVTMVPLVLLFWSLSKRREFAQPSHDAKLRAAS
jgi:predicted MFS family arabinose efflux permease